MAMVMRVPVRREGCVEERMAWIGVDTGLFCSSPRALSEFRLLFENQPTHSPRRLRYLPTSTRPIMHRPPWICLRYAIRGA